MTRIFILLLLSITLLSSAIANDKSITLIGTVHDKHVSFSGYSLAYFPALLNLVKPDLVLIEMEDQDLKNNVWSKTSPEMIYIFDKAKEFNYPTRGFNLHTNKKLLTNEEMAIYVKWANQFSFEDINREMNLGMLENNERQKVMLANIDAILKAEKNKKNILIFTGFTHKEKFGKHLISQGYQVKLAIDSSKLKVQPLAISQQTKKHWDMAIEELKKSPEAIDKGRLNTMEKFRQLK